MSDETKVADPFDGIDLDVQAGGGTLPDGTPAVAGPLDALKILASAYGVPAGVIDTAVSNLEAFGEGIAAMIDASTAKDEAACLASTLAAARDAHAVGAADLAAALIERARNMMREDPPGTAGG